MSLIREDLILEVTKLKMEPDQILVVSSRRALSDEEKGRTKREMQEVLPEGVKCVVLDSDYYLAVVEAEEPFQAASGLKYDWFDCSCSFTCPCGAEEIILIDESGRCDCGREYRLKANVEVRDHGQGAG